MTWFLIGLQWAGIAFGAFMAVIGLITLVYIGASLVYGRRSDTESAGASEGDLRNFHLGAIEDEFYREER